MSANGFVWDSDTHEREWTRPCNCMCSQVWCCQDDCSEMMQAECDSGFEDQHSGRSWSPCTHTSARTHTYTHTHWQGLVDPSCVSIIHAPVCIHRCMRTQAGPHKLMTLYECIKADDALSYSGQRTPKHTRMLICWSKGSDRLDVCLYLASCCKINTCFCSNYIALLYMHSFNLFLVHSCF